MSKALGYSFSQEELRRGIYHPQGHAEREVMILTILSRLRSILEGKESLPMKITEAPVAAPEVVKFQAQLTERMATAYGDDGALKVRIQNGS
jgi:hypothetical protein